ncbi:J domain-containing protein [Bermanella sp. WJH001]|uniref:J domain-containing protein n=1 Tax=Bermanella sp. WJH001 TaxID=3048005 RepID=UPI003F4ABD90
MRQSYLAILGLNHEADLPSIKTAFRRLASIYHPDKNPHQRQRFIEICHAYDQLMTQPEQVKPCVREANRRIGKRGEPTHRRFEIMLEQQYKGVHLSVKI